MWEIDKNLAITERAKRKGRHRLGDRLRAVFTLPVQVGGDGPVKLQVLVPAHAALQLRLLAQVKLNHPGASRGAVRGV